MRTLIIIPLFLVWLNGLKGQSGNAEIMAGHRYLHYTHTIGQRIQPQSILGWQHIATLIKQYKTEKGKLGYSDELMNQAYLTVALSKAFSLKGGVFYTNVGGYKPSIGIQYVLVHKRGSLVVGPRVDIIKKPAYEIFFFSEYYFPATKGSKLVIRFQAMSNASLSHHNRSYQFLRLGLETKGLQYGAGITLDEFGRSNIVHYNAGFFVRKKW